MLLRLRAWLSWLAHGKPATLSQPAPRAENALDRPTKEQQSDADRLRIYVQKIGILDERPALADPRALAWLARLEKSGQLFLATEFGGALATELPSDVALQLQVAELLFRQQLGDAALPLIERVLQHAAAEPAQVLRARWLRAEVAALRGQYSRACADWVCILAEDWNYPGVAERLRRGRADSQRHTGELADHPLEKSSLPSLPALASVSLGTAMAAAPTLFGDTSAAARYRLRRELGSGANGTVYLAEDKELGCEVALKMLHPRPAARGKDAPAVHEARLLARLRHPGVLFLYDLDRAGRYFTMEFCEGGSLRARLKVAPLRKAPAFLRAIELCETLSALHARAVIHGDIKPENLLFRSPRRSLRSPLSDAPYGDLVLSDFGVGMTMEQAAEPTFAKAPDTVQKGAAAGTRAYLAPERLRGAPPSRAADLYAFGVVLNELMAEPDGELFALSTALRSAEPTARPDAQTTLLALRRMGLP